MKSTQTLKSTGIALLFLIILYFFYSCKSHNSSVEISDSESQSRMILRLDSLKSLMDTHANLYASKKKIEYLDSIIPKTTEPSAQLNLGFQKAYAFLELGDENSAVALFEKIAQYVDKVPQSRGFAYQALGVAYMRLAERRNCVMNHSSQSCLMPIEGTGIHQDKEPAKKAIECFQQALISNPQDLDSRWLLNIAYMTIGTYPQSVPVNYLIPGLNKIGNYKINPFKDIAHEMGLDFKSRAGGMICDDFDNDGNLDIVFSAWGLDDPMHYFKNNGDGSFTDLSEKSNLSKFKGGLNLCQTDYNNDGFIDIFVLRGGWQGQSTGIDQPNSLLRNNGDGTFTDVTFKAGIYSEHPTQTATWNDFNKDGWLDVFIGNETVEPGKPQTCELYMNNRNGTFTNVVKKLGLNINEYAKGVTSGDYDNDGWPDIFISTLGGSKILLHNKGCKEDNCFGFENVSEKAGFSNVPTKTFPTWFFDYDNDGFLDIFLCNYEFDKYLSFYCAREAIQLTNDPAGKPMIFRNNRNGTFTNVSAQLGLTNPAFAMGSNFGDFDNDGYLDFYLGTGNPSYQSIIPNRLYRNMEGKSFLEITNAAKVGHLQKGHGVSFADLDNDGDQDISIKMGGAYVGDAYNNSLFMNPGQNNNNWIGIKLVGVKSNKQGIGARITLSIHEGNNQREIFKDVNSGGSFGCSPLRQQIGIGSATVIDEIKIFWPASGVTQVFKNVKPNEYIKVTEDSKAYEKMDIKKIQFKNASKEVIMCSTPK